MGQLLTKENQMSKTRNSRQADTSTPVQKTYLVNTVLASSLQPVRTVKVSPNKIRQAMRSLDKNRDIQRRGLG